MRAVVIKEYGGPEVLEVVDVNELTIERAHRRITVTRAGVNFADLHVRSGDYLADVPLPYTPGNEVAGVLDSGERVVALTRGGGYAEVAQARRSTTFAIPDGVDDETALALTLQGNSAWHLLHTVIRIQQGETVIVPAAAGGVGSLAVQLAKRAGARVVAMAGTKAKREFARSIGADVVVDSSSPTLAAALREAANGGAQAALEMTGGATFQATLKALAPLGRLAVYGRVGSEEGHVDTRDLMGMGLSVTGFWLPLLYTQRDAMRNSMQDLFAAVIAGEITVPAPTVYPLSDVAQAHRDIAARRTTGKVALDPKE
ncbi:zinc-binding alcohol dehydrogenase family protein [Streptomyces sp. NPDC056773]|uniref:quinone oxidoreductase family protein n=1 Tax=unclassified Streptomyces TaxID=2593676 RepID=UPI0036BC3BAE